jgi:ubiquinol-cytochrome c reductase iron-sulfur subunit
MRLGRWLQGFALVRLLRHVPVPRSSDEAGDAGRIVPAGPPERGAELLVLLFLALATACAIGFVVTYAAFKPRQLPDEVLGLEMGGCLIFIACALTVVAKRLVVTEELEEEYPSESPDEQRKVAEIVHESGSRFTRKRLLMAAGAGTGGALGVASLTTVVSIGPFWSTGALDETPWKAGVRLVDEQGHPFVAAEVQERTFYTAFPEGADPELIGSPLIVIRLDPSKLKLPRGRRRWAPGGILAFSKICTHAGCAVALYRKPTFTPVEPNVALVCPCHYSTFDPFTGGQVVYGPAGRPLPQLPLEIDGSGHLRAAGNFSARVGPSWWNVRSRPT